MQANAGSSATTKDKLLRQVLVKKKRCLFECRHLEWGTFPVLQKPPYNLNAGRGFCKDGDGKRNKEIGEGNGKRSSEKGDHWKGRGAEGLGICHFSSFLPSFWNFLQTRICRFTVDTCGSSWLVPSSPFSPGTSLSCKKRVDKERKHRALFTHLKKTEGWLQP